MQKTTEAFQKMEKSFVIYFGPIWIRTLPVTVAAKTKWTQFLYKGALDSNFDELDWVSLCRQ